MKWYHWTAIIILLGGGTAVYYKSRGLRNKNPGNIRRSGDAWQGLKPNQTDDEFFQFSEVKYGIRAMSRILDNYKNRGIQTVAQMINTWAPPTENNSKAYVASVLQKTGWPSVYSPSKGRGDYLPLIKAIIKHENGLNPYSDELIKEGISLA